MKEIDLIIRNSQ